MYELLDEHVLGGGDVLVLFEEIVDGDGDEVWVGDEVPVILHGVEAMLEGIGGRAGLASGGARAGGFTGVGTVGGEGSFGHLLFARLSCRRLSNGRLWGGSLLCGWQRIHSVVWSGVWSCVFHGLTLTRLSSGLMFLRGGFVGNKGNRVLKML